MKHIRTYLLAACLLLALTACGGAPSEQDAQETDWTVQEMASAVWEAGTQLEGMEILPGDELHDTYLTTSCGLDTTQVTDSAIWVAGGASAQEVAVFQLAEDAPSGEIAEVLQTYLENRIGAFTGYLPEEAALLENAEVVSRGTYVALLACEDVEAAQDAFEQCFSKEPPEDTPTASQSGRPEQQAADPSQPTEPEEPASSSEATPESGGEPAASPGTAPEDEQAQRPADETQAAETEVEAAAPTGQAEPTPEPPASESSAQEEVPWSYREDRLLSAWEAGDWSGLAAEDRAILDICREVIDTVVPAGGSEYDQELAVHDWMIAHGRYDNNTLSQLPDFQENPNNDNPYGFLVDGVGICLGYTTTFQLFMDLLDIQCITVEGTAYNYTTDHAWNQVCLDGEWYCVDVTWDDPTTSGTVSEGTAHRFFNVTSDHMRDTNHQWNETSVPEATGTAYAWN